FLLGHLGNGTPRSVLKLIIGQLSEVFSRRILIGAIVKLAMFGSVGDKQIVQLSRFFIIHGSLRAEALHEVIDGTYHWNIPFWFGVSVICLVFGYVLHFFCAKIEISRAHLPRRI